MKSLTLVILFLVAVVALDTMGSGLLRAYTAAGDPCSSTAATPTAVPIATPIPPGTVASDGCITIWSNAPGFNSSTKPFHTSAKVVQGAARGQWNITIANLSIPWSSKTQLTLQDGKVASGVFQESTNAMSLTLPLQGIPIVKTTTIKVSTDGSVNTTDGLINGSPVDPKGNTTLVGSQKILLFSQAQVRIQCKLSPWPLPAKP